MHGYPDLGATALQSSGLRLRLRLSSVAAPTLPGVTLAWLVD
jgi:hypothetical protein